MRNKALTLLFAFLATTAFSQITVLPISLPQAGDTLISAVDENFQPMIGSPSSSAQVWDFSGLQAYSYDTAYFRDTATSPAASEFPSSEVVFNFSFGEAFATLQNDQVEIIGFAAGADLIGVSIAQDLSNPQVYRYTNFTYGAAYADTGEFFIQLDGSIIPPGVFPIQPDSVRLTYYGISADTCDAFGTLTTPTGTFDVLRLKRIQDSEVLAEAKVPLLGWQDVTALLPDAGFGRIVFYEYLSDSSKTAIAQVVVDNDGNPTQTLFRVDTTLPPPVTSIEEVSKEKAFSVFPNPSTDRFTIDVSSDAVGPFILKAYSMDGKMVLQSEVFSPQATIQHTLNSGVYIFSLEDKSGTPMQNQLLEVK